MKKRRLPVLILVVLAFVVAGCQDDPPLSSQPLSVRNVYPPEVTAGGESLLLVEGSGFRDGASVSLNGRQLTQTTFVNQALLATVVPAGTAAGGYPLSVTLPDGSTARAPTSITVVEGRPKPSPTPAPSPTQAPSPPPSPTPAPSPTAAPTPEPQPTPTPAPTAAPTPAPSAAPPRTPAPPAPTQAPTATPMPIFLPPTVPAPLPSR